MPPDTNSKPTATAPTFVVYFPGTGDESRAQIASVEPIEPEPEPAPAIRAPSQQARAHTAYRTQLEQHRQLIDSSLPLRQYMYELAQEDVHTRDILRMSATVRIIFILQMIFGLFGGFMDLDFSNWWLSLEFIFAALGYWAATAFNRVGVALALLWMAVMSGLRIVSLGQTLAGVSKTIIPTSGGGSTTSIVFAFLVAILDILLMAYVFVFWRRIPEYLAYIRGDNGADAVAAAGAGAGSGSGPGTGSGSGPGPGAGPGAELGQSGSGSRAANATAGAAGSSFVTVNIGRS